MDSFQFFNDVTQLWICIGMKRSKHSIETWIWNWNYQQSFEIAICVKEIEPKLKHKLHLLQKYVAYQHNIAALVLTQPCSE